MQRLYIVLFFSILTTACMTSTTYYHYADGSANVYIVKPDSLEYVPVKPEESSTGMYSGGEPKKVMLTAEEFRTVRNMFEAAKQKHDIHIPDRIKTSGMITTYSGKDKTNFILKPNSKELTGIEAELKRLLQK